MDRSAYKDWQPAAFSGGGMPIAGPPVVAPAQLFVMTAAPKAAIASIPVRAGKVEKLAKPAPGLIQRVTHKKTNGARLGAEESSSKAVLDALQQAQLESHF